MQRGPFVHSPASQTVVADARPVPWTPRPRPDWVSALNALGDRGGDLAALVPLDEASLLAAACESTGLDDFGDDAWREPFRLLLADLDGDAALNLLGRMLMRADLVRTLVNRLRMVETRRRHPEIDGLDVRAPIVITGMGRSGTSILHELLACDPGLRAPMTWEMLHPCATPGLDADADRDARIAAADAEWRFWEAVTPEYAAMHENRGDAPNECLLITMHEFASDYWAGGNWTPRYGRWLQRADFTSVYRAHRRFLQLLQWQAPGDEWVLKAPSHLSALPALFAVYPDAQVVITHRDPLRVLGSIVDLLDTLAWQRSDVTHHDAFVARMAGGYPLLWQAVAHQRDTGMVPDDQIVDVRYADLMADPHRTVAAIYERLGRDLPDAAVERMRALLAARPQGHRGRHDYSFEALGLDRDATRAAFADYQARYDVPSEV